MFTLSSFFAGCGALDTGFEQTGFKVIWANEYDTSIHETYRANHPDTQLCTADLRDISPNDIPDCDGFIGGPPCQSWSEGGHRKGLEDERGRLFVTYIEFIKAKHPKFFVIENVKGILEDKHFKTFLSFLEMLKDAGYDVYYKLLNAADFRIPQDRYRVFIVGFSKELTIHYEFPKEFVENRVSLRQAISDISSHPKLYQKNDDVTINSQCPNHDVYIGDYDIKFMARNRVRAWNETSFTIQAQAKNCPLHPQAPKMVYVSPNKRIFVKGKEYLYRRFSVRECARIQSFPDSYKFYYTKIQDGYKMVGNAVPPRLAYYLAKSILEALNFNRKVQHTALIAYYKDDNQLNMTIKNRLYYVRTGFRRGAFNMPVGVPTPEYLLLHRRKQYHVFRLDDTQPFIVGKQELERKGFTPSGNLYLCFKLVEEVVKPDINLLRGLRRGRGSVVPYLFSYNV